MNDNLRPPGVTLDVNGHRVQLKRDEHFNLFKRLLMARRVDSPLDRETCWHDSCHFYKVTATLQGLFAAAPTDRFGGYGHLACCHLLAIQQISDVKAFRKPVPAGGVYQCKDEGSREVTTEEFLSSQRRCSGYRDCIAARAEQISLLAGQKWNDPFNPTTGYIGGVEREWIAFDISRSYELDVQYTKAKRNKQPQILSAILKRRSCIARQSPIPRKSPVTCRAERFVQSQITKVHRDTYTLRDIHADVSVALPKLLTALKMSVPGDLKAPDCSEQYEHGGESYARCDVGDAHGLQLFTFRFGRSKELAESYGVRSHEWVVSGFEAYICGIDEHPMTAKAITR